MNEKKSQFDLGIQRHFFSLFKSRGQKFIRDKTCVAWFKQTKNRRIKSAFIQELKRRLEIKRVSIQLENNIRKKVFKEWKKTCSMKTTQRTRLLHDTFTKWYKSAIRQIISRGNQIAYINWLKGRLLKSVFKHWVSVNRKNKSIKLNTIQQTRSTLARYFKSWRLENYARVYAAHNKRITFSKWKREWYLVSRLDTLAVKIDGIKQAYKARVALVVWRNAVSFISVSEKRAARTHRARLLAASIEKWRKVFCRIKGMQIVVEPFDLSSFVARWRQRLFIVNGMNRTAAAFGSAFLFKRWRLKMQRIHKMRAFVNSLQSILEKCLFHITQQLLPSTLPTGKQRGN